ncbi:MAG TPA: helix-turn-helix domain-containing protein [Candidatus Acidoferrum sp.]|jgi:putative transposase|nr:helix-turn-helix domain-containing protein [Candidatus Acidoferrum sp.]
MSEKPFALRAADQAHLVAITTRGRSAARTMKRASALLQLHAGHTLLYVAQALQVSRQSVARWRDGYLQVGLQALDEKPRSGRPIRIDGKQRARLTALACSTPPEGRARWTLRLLADQAVELGYCTGLSHTQARKILKKTNSNRT